MEIEREIIEEHAQQASLLWTLRDRAALSPLYDLPALLDLDDRLDAHLDGLRIAGAAGFSLSLTAATDTRPSRTGRPRCAPQPGDVFVAAVLAVERWDLRALGRILDAADAAPDGARGIAAALAWLPFENVRGLLTDFFARRSPPVLHWLGITACASHRRDPGRALDLAVRSDDRRLRARALRAVGELGRGDLLDDLRAARGIDDASIRFAAAWSGAILGDPTAAPELWARAREGGPYAERAGATAVRRMDPAAALIELRALAAEGEPRAALAGAAALGDPAAVPWLLEAMETAGTARFAGEVLTQIAGVDLAAAKLATSPPKGFVPGPTDDPDDEDVSMDPDEGLPWPDVAALRAWWSRRADDFRSGQRYAAGRLMEPVWLEEVLRSGRQPERAAAAVELAMRESGRAVFEVRAPGERQIRALERG